MSSPGSPVDPKSSLGSLSCDSGYVDPTAIVTVPILHQEPKIRRVSALSTDWISEKKATQKRNSDTPEENFDRSVQEKTHIPRPSKRVTTPDASWRRFEKEAGKVGVQPMLKKEELDTTSSKAFKFLAKFHPKYKEERPVAPRKQRSKSAEGRPRKSLSMFNSAYTKVISPNTMRKRDEWANTLRSDSILDEEYYKLPYEEINREILGRFSKSEPRLASLRKAKKKVSFTEDVDYNTSDVRFKYDLQSFPSRDSGYFGEKSPDRSKQMDFGHTTAVSSIKQLNEVSVPTIITKQNFAELENLLDLVKKQERRLSDDSAQSGDTSDDDCFSQESEPTHDIHINQDHPQMKPTPLPRTKLPSNSDIVNSVRESTHDIIKIASTDHSSEPNFEKQSQATNKTLLTTNLDDVLTSLSHSSETSNDESVINKQAEAIKKPAGDASSSSQAVLNEENFITPNRDGNSTTESVSYEQLPEADDSNDPQSEVGIVHTDKEEVISPYMTDCSEEINQDMTTSQDQTEDFLYYDEPTSLDVISEIPDEEYWIPSPRSDYELLERYHQASEGLEVVVEVPEDSVTPEPLPKETLNISSEFLASPNNLEPSDSEVDSENEEEEEEKEEDERINNMDHSDALKNNEASEHLSLVESLKRPETHDPRTIKFQSENPNGNESCQDNIEGALPEQSKSQNGSANSSCDKESMDFAQSHISSHTERSQPESNNSERMKPISGINVHQDFHGSINQEVIQEETANSSCITDPSQCTSDQKLTNESFVENESEPQKPCLHENSTVIEKDNPEITQNVAKQGHAAIPEDTPSIANAPGQAKNKEHPYENEENPDQCSMEQSSKVNSGRDIVVKSDGLPRERSGKELEKSSSVFMGLDEEKLSSSPKCMITLEEPSTLPTSSETVRDSCTNLYNSLNVCQSSPGTQTTIISETSREAHRQKMINARKAFFEPNSQQSHIDNQKLPSISIESDLNYENDNNETPNFLPEQRIERKQKDSLKPEVELKRPSSPTPQSPLNQELLSELPQRTSTPENSLDAPSFTPGNCADVPSFQYNSDTNDVTSTSEYVDSIFLSDTAQYDNLVEKQLLYGTKGQEEDVDDSDDSQRKDNEIELESDSGKSSNSDGIEYDSAAETGSDSDELLHIDMSRDTNFDSSFNSEDSLLSKPFREVELSKSLSQIVEYDSATESGSDKEESHGSIVASSPDSDSFGGKGKSPNCQKIEYDSAFSTASTPFSEPDSDTHQNDANHNVSGKSSCTISHETSTSTKLKMRHDVNIPGTKTTQTPSSGSPNRKRNSTLLSSFTKPSEVETKTSQDTNNLTAKELEEFNRKKIKEALLKAGISPSVLELLDKDQQVEKSGFETSMANIFMTKDLSFTDHQLVLSTRTNSVNPRVTVSRVRVPLSQIRSGWLFSSDSPLVDQKLPEQIESEKLSEPIQTLPTDSPTPSSSSDGSSSGCFSSACSPIPVPGTIVREVPFPTAL